MKRGDLINYVPRPPFREDDVGFWTLMAVLTVLLWAVPLALSGEVIPEVVAAPLIVLGVALYFPVTLCRFYAEEKNLTDTIKVLNDLVAEEKRQAEMYRVARESYLALQKSAEGKQAITAKRPWKWKLRALRQTVSDAHDLAQEHGHPALVEKLENVLGQVHALKDAANGGELEGAGEGYAGQ